MVHGDRPRTRRRRGVHVSDRPGARVRRDRLLPHARGRPAPQAALQWKGGPVDTVVTWSLADVEGGTRLRIEQSGFAGLRAFFVSLLLRSGGRTLYGEKLAEHLDRAAGAPPRGPCMRPSTRFFRFLATLFARRGDEPDA